MPTSHRVLQGGAPGYLDKGVHKEYKGKKQRMLFGSREVIVYLFLRAYFGNKRWSLVGFSFVLMLNIKSLWAKDWQEIVKLRNFFFTL